MDRTKANPDMQTILTAKIAQRAAVKAAIAAGTWTEES